MNEFKNWNWRLHGTKEGNLTAYFTNSREIIAPTMISTSFFNFILWHSLALNFLMTFWNLFSFSGIVSIMKICGLFPWCFSWTNYIQNLEIKITDQNNRQKNHINSRKSLFHIDSYIFPDSMIEYFHKIFRFLFLKFFYQFSFFNL